MEKKRCLTLLALQQTVVAEQVPPRPNHNFSNDSIHPALILDVCCGERQHVGLTSNCATCSICSKVIRVAAVGRSIIPALIDLVVVVVGWRGLGLGWLLWFGWAGNHAGSEESRDGQELGEMHCGVFEIGQVLWLIERLSQWWIAELLGYLR